MSVGSIPTPATELSVGQVRKQVKRSGLEPGDVVGSIPTLVTVEHRCSMEKTGLRRLSSIVPTARLAWSVGVGAARHPGMVADRVRLPGGPLFLSGTNVPRAGEDALQASWEGSIPSLSVCLRRLFLTHYCVMS